MLVVGLGNPGTEYALTPHNLGFMVVDRLAEGHGIRITRRECQALLGEGKIGEHPVALAKPLTYMNRSGPSVKSLLVKLGLEPKAVLLIHDELDLPWTALRIRPRGSAAGHHGVESVIAALGSQDFPRIRIGIHPGHPISDGAVFVLQPFKRSRMKEVDELVGYASQAVESIIAEGVSMAMTKFNRRAQGLTQEEK